MSYKNLLQEHTQKLGLPLPVYKTSPVIEPGLQKILGWTSTVYVNFNKEKNEFTIKNFTGRIATTKIMAESNAACECLRSLEIINTTSITTPIQPIQVTSFNTADFQLAPGSFYQNFNLIDLENTPSFNITPKKDILYIGFINAHHHSIKEYEKKWNIFNDLSTVQNILTETYQRTDLYPNCIAITIMGGVKDLSDHLMTSWLSFLIDYIKLIHNPLKLTINLCSRDRGVWCTKECLLKLLKFNQLNMITDLNVVSSV